jgi:hypothetical protein
MRTESELDNLELRLCHTGLVNFKAEERLPDDGLKFHRRKILGKVTKLTCRLSSLGLLLPGSLII